MCQSGRQQHRLPNQRLKNANYLFRPAAPPAQYILKFFRHHPATRAPKYNYQSVKPHIHHMVRVAPAPEFPTAFLLSSVKY